MAKIFLSILLVSIVSCTLPWGQERSEAYSLVVHNGTVYAAGSRIQGSSFNSSRSTLPVYWKNGQRVNLPFIDHYGTPDNSPWVKGSFFLGDDLYYWGGTFIMNNGLIGKRQVYYWKNEIFHELPNQSDFPIDFSIYQTRTISLDASNLGYWLDDKFIPLDGKGSLTAMLVDGNDLYFVGTDDSNPKKGWIWKNGNSLSLEIPENSEFSLDEMVTVGGQVFTAGSILTGYSSGTQASSRTSPSPPLGDYDICLWKESVKIVLGKVQSRGQSPLQMVTAGNSLFLLSFDGVLEGCKLFIYDVTTGFVKEEVIFLGERVIAIASDGFSP